MSRDIPTSSGVYQIRCKQNGKIYVGSAVNLRACWDLHCRLLTVKQHHNPHLQSAWNLYGAANFEFSVLQYADESQLLTTEQICIERTGCIDRDIGFNIRPYAGQLFTGRSKLKSHKGWTHVNSVRQREYIKTHEGFIDPDGRAVGPVRNLAAFCRNHGLEKTHSGAVVRITNLSAFCRAVGLCKVHMFELKNGKRPSHEGWTWKYDADKAFG